MSKQVARSMDVEAEIARLERRHRGLKERVAELDRRFVLTPAEQRERADLKKRKLALKDSLFDLRRERASEPTSPVIDGRDSATERRRGSREHTGPFEFQPTQ